MKTAKIAYLAIVALCSPVALLQAKELGCEVTEQQASCTQESASKPEVACETDKAEVAQNVNDSSKDAQSGATSADTIKTETGQSNNQASNENTSDVDFEDVDIDDNEQ